MFGGSPYDQILMAQRGPKTLIASGSSTKNNKHIKTYLMKNGCHDQDRQRAKNIVANIVEPTGRKEVREMRRNPFFASAPRKEVNLNLKIKDMVALQ